MELRHLRYFVAVAEEENVTRAAERLHVSQPPLSRQIRDLEEELSVTLFERTARTVRLTTAGKLFLEESRAVLQRVEAAMQSVKAAAGGIRGELSIGFAPSLTVEILPEVLRLFQPAFPGIKVTLHDMSSEEMLSGVEKGTLQLALMAMPDPKRLKGLSGLSSEKLRDYELSVALHPNHPLSWRKTLRIGDLKDELLIGYSRSGYPEYHEYLIERLGGGEKKSSRKSPINEEHDSVTALMAAVESGRGVGIVASCIACLAGPRLVVRPLRPRAVAISAGVVWREKSPDAVTIRFLETLRSTVRKK
jgi:DNA-binding transcriptional LysR family regulator